MCIYLLCGVYIHLASREHVTQAEDTFNKLCHCQKREISNTRSASYVYIDSQSSLLILTEISHHSISKRTCLKNSA